MDEREERKIEREREKLGELSVVSPTGRGGLSTRRQRSLREKCLGGSRQDGQPECLRSQGDRGL